LQCKQGQERCSRTIQNVSVFDFNGTCKYLLVCQNLKNSFFSDYDKRLKCPPYNNSTAKKHSNRQQTTTLQKILQICLQEKRTCYIAGEFTLKTSKFYTATNCINKCVANIMFAACGCLQYYQPSNLLIKINPVHVIMK